MRGELFCLCGVGARIGGPFSVLELGRASALGALDGDGTSALGGLMVGEEDKSWVARTRQLTPPYDLSHLCLTCLFCRPRLA
jgi:hypothetical protein